MAGKQKKEQWLYEMTPVCDRCRKPAPIREDMSTSCWTVYDTKQPCECGGKYVARFMLEETDNGT